MAIGWPQRVVLTLRLCRRRGSFSQATVYSGLWYLKTFFRFPSFFVHQTYLINLQINYNCHIALINKLQLYNNLQWTQHIFQLLSVHERFCYPMVYLGSHYLGYSRPFCDRLPQKHSWIHLIARKYKVDVERLYWKFLSREVLCSIKGFDDFACTLLFPCPKIFYAFWR